MNKQRWKFRFFWESCLRVKTMTLRTITTVKAGGICIYDALFIPIWYLFGFVQIKFKMEFTRIANGKKSFNFITLHQQKSPLLPWLLHKSIYRLVDVWYVRRKHHIFLPDKAFIWRPKVIMPLWCILVCKNKWRNTRIYTWQTYRAHQLEK